MTQGAWVNKDGENVVVSAEGAELGRVPIHTIGAVVCFGQVAVSAPLMGAASDAGVRITHLTENGRFLARVEGPVSGNVLLRRTQYRWADDPVRRAGIVKSILAGKILNQRTVVERTLRDYGDTFPEGAKAKLVVASDRLRFIARRLELPLSVDELRGAEGEAGQTYFSVFDQLVRGEKPLFAFQGRSRRPPMDPVNALLSFLYKIIHRLRYRL